MFPDRLPLVYSLGIQVAMRLSNFLQASVFPLLGAALPEQSQTVFDLSEAKWTLSNPIYGISVPGTVPSQAHLDLHSAGVVPDPYFGLGDFELRWVAEANWTYSTELEGL
jgi:beta-mannosidase